ncbi:MAG: TonB-dependent siderophore receptor [Pseudomonas putida]|jgi:outer membrane receptor for ferric coprogen and ferric-rhodotorulic acid
MLRRDTHHAYPRKPLVIAMFSAALLIQAWVVQPLGPAGQARAAEATRSYSIAGGPLGAVLSRFASDAGVVLSFEAELTQGKQSPGLQGAFSVEQGFARLLAGSDLQVMTASNGNYLLLPRASDGALELGATSINAMGLGATTEGTGSYTTGATSTATKMNLSIRETPQTISVITRQRIEDQQLNSITSVLNQTPGVTMTQDGGRRYNIYSRGSAIDTYQVDGVTTTQVNETRTMPSTLLDTVIYDHIEVVRGATGLMTGAGSPSGVVNLIRKRPTREFQAHVQQSVGSWDTYRSEVDVAGPLTEGGTLRGRFVAAHEESDSFRDWYKEDKDTLYGVLETDLSDVTLLRFGVDYHVLKNQGSPEVPLLFTNGRPTHFSRSTSSGARWMFDNYEIKNYFVNLERALANDWAFKVAANYQDTERDNYSGSGLSSTNSAYLNQETGEMRLSTYRAITRQNQTGVDVTLDGPFQLGGRTHQLIVGYNFQNYNNHMDGYETHYPTVNFFTWGNVIERPVRRGAPEDIFSIETRQRGSYAAVRLNVMDNLNIILGARASDYDYDYFYGAVNGDWGRTSSMKKHGEVTPYAGITYDITPEQTLYASYTDIFKPQTAVDRNGKLLDPEIGSNYEMGWKGEFFGGRLTANAAIYLIQKENLAVRDGTVAGSASQAAYKAETGETQGIDLEISGEILPNWNAQASYSYSRTENPEGDRLLTQLPMDSLRLWNTYRLTGDWDRLTVGGGVTWNSGISLYYPQPYNSKISQGDYTVVSLMARYQITPTLATTVNVNNLFDEKYYSGIGGSVGHYGDPRNASVNLRYDF